MNQDLMFSSATSLWNTPFDLIADLATVFSWDLDVCASGPNVCANYYAEADDGLAQPWRGLCWMNPPYGRGIGQWMKKARIVGTHSSGSSVVCLIPARTDTTWFQNNAIYASQIVFVRGRLTFGSTEAWRQRYETQLAEATTKKAALKLVKKIGGAHCGEEARRQAKMALIEPDDMNQTSWLDLEYAPAYTAWLSADHIRPDAAPFPCAFMVFGALTQAQHEKLVSYGLAGTLTG